MIVIALAWQTLSAIPAVTFPIEKTGMSDEALRSEFWDATKVSTNECYGLGSIVIEPTGLVKETLGGFTELYQYHNDKILWRGFTIGRSIGCIVDSVVITAPLPIEPKGCDEYPFSGSVNSHDIILYNLSGTCVSQVSGRGRFVLSPGDTIPATLLVEHRHYVNNEDNPATPDTTSVQFYRWYSPGNTLPFAVQVRRSGYSEILFLTSDIPEIYDSDILKEDSVDYQNLFDTMRVSSSYGNLNITLGQLSGAYAEAYIVDVSGNIYGRTRSMLSDEENNIDIPLYGLSSGTYMLVVTINDNPEYVYKQILQL